MITTYLRRSWRWLTNMRTALVLLFLLALGAIPGALIPQRSINEFKVQQFIEANPRISNVYERLQLFDVFSSSWFTAIYVLLFVSLVGCIIPRTIEHYRAWKADPVRPPKNLERLTHHYTGELLVPWEEVPGRLKGWRVKSFAPAEDRAGRASYSAERGYAREAFNLAFHLGLAGILVTFALGKLAYYEGQVIVIAGTENNSTFCNTAVANYDSFRFGALVDGTELTPLCVNVHDFTADYLPNGQAEMFTSHISYTTDPLSEEPWQETTLRVNHPLRVAGDRVYLQGHGFAPEFTVTWPNGESRTQIIQFQPDDPTLFLSSGVLRFDPPAGLYPDPYERRTHQLAIQGLFAPTAKWDGKLLSSAFPAMRDPAVAIDIYRGDTGLDTGKPQSIFTLDSQQLHSGALQKLERVNLGLGESITLDDGTVVRFDGAKEFVNLQVSHDPFSIWLLLSTIVTIVGMVGSVSIRRRRIFIRRAEDVAPGSTPIVTIAGLSKTGTGEEFTALARKIVSIPEDSDDNAQEDASRSSVAANRTSADAQD